MHGLIVSCFLEYQYGGAEVVVRQLAKMLPQSGSGVSVEALCLGGGTAPVDAAKVHRVRISPLFREGGRLAGFMKRYILFFSSPAREQAWARHFNRLVPDLSRFDFVHCCDQHWLSAAAELARAHGKPLVMTSHDNMPRELFPGQTFGMLERFLNARLQQRALSLRPALGVARIITAPSKACLSTIERFMRAHEVTGPELRVTDNWIEDYLLPAPDTPAAPVNSRLFFAGRLSREKGVDLLLQAHRRMSDVGLTIVGGNGPLEGMVARHARTTPKERFTWIPKLPHEKMIAEMRRHALVVLPSRFDEPFGKTVLEARLSQSRILTTTAGGIPEILEDYPSATLLQHKLEEGTFVEQLVAAARRMLAEPNQPEQPFARVRFLERYSAAAGVRRYVETYERACRHSRA